MMDKTTHTSFTFGDRTLHANRRALMSHAFSRSNLLMYQDDLQRKAAALQLNFATNKTVNLLDAFRFYAIDIVSLLSFGIDLKQCEDFTYCDAIRDFDAMTSKITLVAFKKYIWLLKKIPNKNLQFLLGSSNRFMNGFAGRLIDDFLDKPDEVSETSVISKMYHNRAESLIPITRKELVGEAILLIAAGADSTALTLTFCIWELLCNLNVMERLQAEIDAVHCTGIPNVDVLEKLPFMDAVLKETMRVHSAVMGWMPRRVPDQGAVVQGVFLPGGTIAGVQAYTIHRDPDLFPNPETFLPDRWLHASAQMKKVRTLDSCSVLNR